jgi:methylglutaconyl-CoA hydratase
MEYFGCNFMPNIITQQHGNILQITFNRIEKHNAFNEHLLNELQVILNTAETQDDLAVIILNGNGKHFSAGADLQWMQRMANLDLQENLIDAEKFAKVMAALANSSKTTIAMIHGKTIGGGVGLVAACDIAIATNLASFACPEVKIGLIPAVISPYVINAIGQRAARYLFLSAETIDAQRAYELQLIHYCVAENQLHEFTFNLANKIAQNAPTAMQATKKLITSVTTTHDQNAIQNLTANLLATQRKSKEGQIGINAILNHTTPKWS